MQFNHGLECRKGVIYKKHWTLQFKKGDLSREQENQGFYKMQMTMPSIMVTKRKHGKDKVTSGGFIIFLSCPWHLWIGNMTLSINYTDI